MSETYAGRDAAPIRLLLGLSLPIAAGALVASLAGLLEPSVYGSETANWAAQGRGQDAVNLLVYPVMLTLAWRAARGSLAAFLGWLGVAAYSAYSYLLYAGWVHFGGLFLIYVAVFGLSCYALIGGLAVLDPVRVRTAFRRSVPHRGVGIVLAVLGCLFALLWLSEILPSLLGGTVPHALTDAGLASNPVWVLDLALVLPAMVVAGVMLRRDRPLGYLLAVPLLVFGIVMGSAIVGMFVALAAAGEPLPAAPALMIALVVILESAALARLLQKLRPDTRPAAVFRHATLSAPTEPAGAGASA